MSKSTTARKVENRILAGLPQEEYDRLQSHLESVNLEYRQVLCEPGDRIDYVYFPTKSAILLLNRTQIGLAAVGKEGVVGLPVFLGSDVAGCRAMCQVAGEALRVKAQVVRDEVSRRSRLRDTLGLFTEALFIQVAQSAACNASHPVQARCCRWMLALHDRCPVAKFPLTQEDLSHLLGVRRASVADEAREIRSSGAIQYVKSYITVANRKTLESKACECYRLVKDQYDRLLG